MGPHLHGTPPPPSVPPPSSQVVKAAGPVYACVLSILVWATVAANCRWHADACPGPHAHAAGRRLQHSGVSPALRRQPPDVQAARHLYPLGEPLHQIRDVQAPYTLR